MANENNEAAKENKRMFPQLAQFTDLNLSLDDSWRQQPGTPVYATDFDAEGVRRALSEATRGRAAEWRGPAYSPESDSPLLRVLTRKSLDLVSHNDF